MEDERRLSNQIPDSSKNYLNKPIKFTQILNRSIKVRIMAKIKKGANEGKDPKLLIVNLVEISTKKSAEGGIAIHLFNTKGGVERTVKYTDIKIPACPECGKKKTIKPINFTWQEKEIAGLICENCLQRYLPTFQVAANLAAIMEKKVVTPKSKDNSSRNIKYGQEKYMPQMAVSASIAPVSLPEPSSSGSNVIFCTNCGSQNPAGVKFCKNCGSPVDFSRLIDDLAASRAQKVETPKSKVNFSVYGPQTVALGQQTMIELWLYGSDQSDLLAQKITVGTISLQNKGPILMSMEEEITAQLSFESPEIIIHNGTETIVWLGEPTNAQFGITVPEDFQQHSVVGYVDILKLNQKILRIMFKLAIGEVSEEPGQLTQEIQQFVKSAFASYSSKDREEVLQHIRALQALNVDVFLDVLSLRLGEEWEEEIYRNIMEKDVLLLFWSKNTANSEWVRKEYLYALEQKGSQSIIPIPLSSPDEVPPPAELNHLHFNDIYLMTRKNRAK
jgi:hypothetical protein